MDDPEYARMKKWELEDNELDENEEESALGLQENADRRFVDELNADSDDELKAGSEDDADPGMLRLSDSEDDLEAPLDDNMKPRSEEEVQKRLKERRKEARAKRLDFKKFFMPKLSSLRKAAGLNPPEKKEKVEVAKRFDKEAGEAPVNKGLVADLKDSAKEVLAYFTGEELYEHKPLEFSDIPDIFSSMWYTQKRRFLINVVGYYNLNLTGFKKYYTPASKTLLMACRSKYVKPFYIADLLEEGADPNIAEKGTDSRPLHYLVRRCNLKGVKFLVEAGADILAYDAQHRNALLCACDTPRTGDQLRIIRYLLSRPEHKGGKNLEHRDTSGNTAAINAVFKGNVWILRTLLLAGARVTEDDPSMGYESAHHVALWVYAAGLLSDIDQLPPVALNTPEAMSCFWHAFSPKGHYYWAPALLFQHQYKYSNELCLRMCQNAKKREDLVEFAPKLRRAVLLMNDEKAVTRKSKRETKEIDRIRKEKHDKKLISRKLDHEVKQVAEWNRQRLMFAARIDGEFKKGLRGQGDKLTHEWVIKQQTEEGGKVWGSQPKVGGHYISNAPPISPTKVKPIELAAVLQEKHNKTHNPEDHIHIYGGDATGNAYAKASWVERDEKVRLSNLQRDADDEDKKSKPNGWKLASRTELGYIDKNSQWAKNKTVRPFIVPPTEEDVYLSDCDDERSPQKK